MLLFFVSTVFVIGKPEKMLGQCCMFPRVYTNVDKCEITLRVCVNSTKLFSLKSCVFSVKLESRVKHWTKQKSMSLAPSRFLLSHHYTSWSQVDTVVVQFSHLVALFTSKLKRIFNKGLTPLNVCLELSIDEGVKLLSGVGYPSL